MEDQLRQEVVISHHGSTGLWDWETEEFCCEELGFETEDEARQDFERFLSEEGWNAPQHY